MNHLHGAEKNPKGGRPRKWGKRLPSPQDHDQWNVPWQQGRAYVYGRVRTFRYKCLRCCWAVSGPEEIMFAFVFEVPGYDKLWATITSAADLSASQTLSANAGRFRQEDGFRDHKQRLGMEECRAWTKEPVLRTFQVQMMAQTLLRLMQFRLDRHHLNLERPQHRFLRPRPTFFHAQSLLVVAESVFLAKSSAVGRKHLARRQVGALAIVAHSLS